MQGNGTQGCKGPVFNGIDFKIYWDCSKVWHMLKQAIVGVNAHSSFPINHSCIANGFTDVCFQYKVIKVINLAYTTVKTSYGTIM